MQRPLVVECPPSDSPCRESPFHMPGGVTTKALPTKGLISWTQLTGPRRAMLADTPRWVPLLLSLAARLPLPTRGCGDPPVPSSMDDLVFRSAFGVLPLQGSSSSQPPRVIPVPLRLVIPALQTAVVEPASRQPPPIGISPFRQQNTSRTVLSWSRRFQMDLLLVPCISHPS